MAELVQADAVIIGAGCAGLAAAVRLSGRGAKVVVVEQAPRLGGRATSFVDRESGERVDNGQHVLFGCYRETYKLLNDIGAADHAPLERTLQLTMAGGLDGKSFHLHCPELPSPWHLMFGLLTWSAVPVVDRLAARHMKGLLQDAHRRRPEDVAAGVDPSLTVTDWLTARHQPASMRKWLWNPLAYAALNQSPDDAAARPFVRVLAEMFGPDPHAAAVGLPRVPLDELMAAPAVEYIQARGGTVLTKRPARIAVNGERIASVKVGDTTIRAATVISAVPWHAFSGIWEESVPASLGDVARNAAGMRSTPIVTVNLWFDRAVMARRPSFLGVSDGTMQWVFDREAITGTGGHLSAVSSGAVDLVRLENDDLVARAEADVRRVLPAAARATLTRALVVREPRAGFSLAPNAPPRPKTITPLQGFLLAGDWTDTGLPATIEGAVRSGVAAAARA
ncbi:MAG: FAD-dependent oxidoreductase [Acidobacteria bacterium]|nr:MAG: FAD-dependent oxidoreductase [Acidobacteriota bacterium]